MSVSIPSRRFSTDSRIPGTNVRGGNGHRCLDIPWPTASLSESNNWSTSLKNVEPPLPGCSMADGIAVGVEQLVDEPQEHGAPAAWMFHGRRDRCRSRTISRRASITWSPRCLDVHGRRDRCRSRTIGRRASTTWSPRCLDVHGRRDRCRSRTIVRRASIKLGVCCPYRK